MPKISATTYAPDVVTSYAPPELIDTGTDRWFDRLALFLPAGQAPAQGFPVVILWLFPEYLCTGVEGYQVNRPANDAEFDAHVPWTLLEAGVAVIVAGLCGVNSADYAPGGAQFEGGTGLLDLPAEVPGGGTFDTYGNTAPGFDHHPAVGQATTISAEYRSPNRCASWVVQKAWELSESQPINPTLMSSFSRAAAAGVGAWTLWGPEEQDTSATDFRRYPSRVKSAFLSVGMHWWPWLQLETTQGAKYFPSEAAATPTNPGGSGAPQDPPQNLEGLNFVAIQPARIEGGVYTGGQDLEGLNFVAIQPRAVHTEGQNLEGLNFVAIQPSRVYSGDASSPGSAASLADVPDLYLREASPLRFATRDWTHVGGESGAQIRERNGAKAVYLRHAEAAQWGLTTSSIEQLLTFVGTDANDNRVPAIAEEFLDELQPGCLGLLAMARLWEIQPESDFHATRSRLTLAENYLQLLDGAQAPSLGVPALDLVTGSPPAGELSGMLEAQDYLAWLLAEFEFQAPAFAQSAEAPPEPDESGVDIRLFVQDADAQLGKLDLLRDPGLGTAVLASIFTDRRLPDSIPLADRRGRRGAWFDTEDDRWGSLLWQLDRAKRTRATLVEAERYAEQALEWLVADGIASGVTARAEFQADRLVLELEIRRGTATEFEHLWRGTLDTSYDQGLVELSVAFVGT